MKHENEPSDSVCHCMVCGSEHFVRMTITQEDGGVFHDLVEDTVYFVVEETTETVETACFECGSEVENA